MRTSSLILGSNVLRNLHLSFYRPQRNCEGYVFTCVRQSFCPQEGRHPSMHCRCYPSMPCSRGCYPSIHCRCHPSMPRSRGGVPAPGGMPAQGGCLIQGVPAPGGCMETPPRKQTATVAYSMHPTGMHYCSLKAIVSKANFQP